MCQLCVDHDGDARCNDCRVRVCLDGRQHEHFTPLAIRTCEQAVIMADGEILCDGCALLPPPAATPTHITQDLWEFTRKPCQKPLFCQGLRFLLISLFCLIRHPSSCV